MFVQKLNNKIQNYIYYTLPFHFCPPPQKKKSGVRQWMYSVHCTL